MLEIPVWDENGLQVGQLSVDPQEFGGRLNRQLLHDVVVMYLANRRQGTVKTKNRAEVSGSGRKLYRQKGTGLARVGDRRTGKRVGGGMTHAKRPRSYYYRLPRKAAQTATRMAFLSKILDEELKVIRELRFEEPKTKRMAQILQRLGLNQESCLVVPRSHDEILWKSARNIDGVAVLPVTDLNAWALLRYRRLLITQEAFEYFRQRAQELRCGGASVPVGSGEASGLPS
jgi:large subunit ribosomal protein L4